MRYYFPISTLCLPERRGLERFKLSLLAKVEVLASGEKQVFNLVTNNISGNGAYFHMLHPISNDTRVRVTITIASEFVKEITGFQMRLKVEGRVVRSEPTGMAIKFNENSKIKRISNA